ALPARAERPRGGSRAPRDPGPSGQRRRRSGRRLRARPWPPRRVGPQRSVAGRHVLTGDRRGAGGAPAAAQLTDTAYWRLLAHETLTSAPLSCPLRVDDLVSRKGGCANVADLLSRPFEKWTTRRPSARAQGAESVQRFSRGSGVTWPTRPSTGMRQRCAEILSRWPAEKGRAPRTRRRQSHAGDADASRRR